MNRDVKVLDLRNTSKNYFQIFEGALGKLLVPLTLYSTATGFQELKILQKLHQIAFYIIPENRSNSLILRALIYLKKIIFIIF